MRVIRQGCLENIPLNIQHARYCTAPWYTKVTNANNWFGGAKSLISAINQLTKAPRAPDCIINEL